MNFELKEVHLPEFGIPETAPTISLAIYNQRVERVRQIMREKDLDALVVYGDREHNANLTYLSAYDPRFEEGLLVIGKNDTPALLVGNEGWGYSELTSSHLNRILYQPLSLMGQSRDKSESLSTILTKEGIVKGSKVGVAGWKYFSEKEFKNPKHVFEVPSYLIEELKGITGGLENLTNVNAVFMNPDNGLRIINEAEQLAAFEFASCYTSQGLRNVYFGLELGKSELETATLMGRDGLGLPYGAHLMLTSGPRATYGLPSPSTDTLKLGDRFTMCLCHWGALTSRAGFLVHDETELPEGIQDYLDKLVIPYFKAITAWYEHIGIGVTGKELYEIVMDILGDPFFGIFLNPGHYIHLDEWVHSPIWEGSNIALKSGMALQVDVIPATGTEYYTSNIEDGIALADENLRVELAQKYPDMWARIQARRKFMKEVIGINLKPEVLPFSNIPAYLAPYVLSPQKVMTVQR